MKKYSIKYSTFEELYKDNRKLVYIFLTDITDIEGDEFIKEDLASAVWIKIFERGEKFLDMDRLWVKNYIRIMVRNAARDYIKAEKRGQKAARDAAALFSDLTEHSAEEEFLTAEDAIYLENACRVLEDEEKDIIQMKFAYKMSAKEISDILEISEEAVRVRQFRVIRKLRNEIIRLKKANE